MKALLVLIIIIAILVGIWNFYGDVILYKYTGHVSQGREVDIEKFLEPGKYTVFYFHSSG